MNRQVRPRSWFQVRWRQFRNPPPPVLRAVLSSSLVAVAGGILLLAYDLSLPRAGRPGGDLRTLFSALYVVVVAVAGSVLTYLWVPLPTGASGRFRRSAWSALLGLFAALPVAYLGLVIAFHLIRPLLG